MERHRRAIAIFVHSPRRETPSASRTKWCRCTISSLATSTTLVTARSRRGARVSVDLAPGRVARRGDGEARCGQVDARRSRCGRTITGLNSQRVGPVDKALPPGGHCRCETHPQKESRSWAVEIAWALSLAAFVCSSVRSCLHPFILRCSLATVLRSHKIGSFHRRFNFLIRPSNRFRARFYPFKSPPLTSQKEKSETW